MRKFAEQNLPKTCWNSAWPDELVFVLLGRDAAAPAAIKTWIEERIRLKLNDWNDPQIVEAKKLVLQMEEEREDIRQLMTAGKREGV